MEFPEPTNVSFEVGEETEFQPDDRERDLQLNGPGGEVSSTDVTPPERETPQPSVQSNRSESKTQPKSSPSRPKSKPRRAADGSTINPFFQD